MLSKLGFSINIEFWGRKWGLSKVGFVQSRNKPKIQRLQFTWDTVLVVSFGVDSKEQSDVLPAGDALSVELSLAIVVRWRPFASDLGNEHK
eukprot:6458871-Amphidinium_carterae.1